jgi:hypothetical protein
MPGIKPQRDRYRHTRPGCKEAATGAGQAGAQTDQVTTQRRHAMTAKAEQKSFAASDETREFERGTLDLVRIGGAEIGRLTLQPGWRWSDHVKPLAGTDLCEAPHFQYHVQGVLHVVMADGSEFDARPGDVTALPQGHDAWVIGDEPVVVVDWYGASNYARS